MPYAQPCMPCTSELDREQSGFFPKLRAFQSTKLRKVKASKVHSKYKAPFKVDSKCKAPFKVHSKYKAPFKVHSKYKAPFKVHSTFQSTKLRKVKAAFPNGPLSGTQSLGGSLTSIFNSDMSLGFSVNLVHWSELVLRPDRLVYEILGPELCSKCCCPGLLHATVCSYPYVPTPRDPSSPTLLILRGAVLTAVRRAGVPGTVFAGTAAGSGTNGAADCYRELP
eukprot:861494-Rhodomonas_salina.1